jgi:hypothetical protein
MDSKLHSSQKYSLTHKQTSHMKNKELVKQWKPINLQIIRLKV